MRLAPRAGNASPFACSTTTSVCRPTPARPRRILQRSICSPKTAWMRTSRGRTDRADLSILGPAVRSTCGEVDHAVLSKDTRHLFVIQCEVQDRKSSPPKGAGALERRSAVQPRSHRCTTDQRIPSASEHCRGPTSIQSHTGAYLIGADGGRSTVRKRSEIVL